MSPYLPDPKLQDPIVIAGAGPVGLFCALLLVRSGVPVIVLERNQDIAEDMRASTFHPATLDLLARCELSEELVASGTEGAVSEGLDSQAEPIIYRYTVEKKEDFGKFVTALHDVESNQASN